MKRTVFALIDCNNFFVSCERLFRPELATRPVVVLSSNDGCAVSRSNEAKAIGIPMGAPAFKFRQTFRDHGVVSFSANFELYGDMSKRIIDILTTVTPRIEVYSVDESFLDLGELHINDYAAWGREVRARILRETGIPVSIGIAPSKTLAKIATDRAKQNPEMLGACNLYDVSSGLRHKALTATNISHVWGVGWRLAPQLRARGLATAADLANLRPQLAKQLMGVHGEQMVRELNGTSCIPLEREHKPAKSIARTRTFGQDTNQPHIVEAALASFATQAAYRLRKSGQLTRRAGIFLTTSRHKPGYKRWGSEVVFRTPTADTGLLIQSAIDEFSRLYDPRVQYHRAGVLLHDFVPGDQLQADLLGEVDVASHQKSLSRMAAIDHINTRYGRQTMRYAAEDLGDAWQPKHQQRSPRYTTVWDELPRVRIAAH
jgi:DNA polymerase V